MKSKQEQMEDLFRQVLFDIYLDKFEEEDEDGDDEYCQRRAQEEADFKVGYYSDEIAAILDD